jgi:hypothetical protein
MRIRYNSRVDGPGPSEAIVTVTTRNGSEEEVILDRSYIEGDTISVSRIGQEDDAVLVELPQESASGRWRIWVGPDVVA